MAEADRSGTGAPKSPQLAIGPWAVAFLDLLGYQEVLARFDGSDETQAPDDIRAAFARAVKLRRRLIGAVTEFLAIQQAQSSSPIPELAQMPSEYRSIYAEVRKFELLHAPGADHVVLGCSLTQRSPVRAVRSLAMAAAYAALFQLAMGADDPEDTRPLRGGIDLGLGEVVDDFLYSPAMSGAYKLESEGAIYARIVASANLIRYLSDFVERDAVTLEDRYHQAEASVTLPLFFEDRDGFMTLDFMGETARARTGGPEAASLAARAWKYVNHAHASHYAGGAYKFAAKYAWLIGYMRERLPAWGVKP